MGLDIIDNKAYIKYSQGEESMVSSGTIIDLEQKNKFKMSPQKWIKELELLQVRTNENNKILIENK